MNLPFVVVVEVEVVLGGGDAGGSVDGIDDAGVVDVAVADEFVFMCETSSCEATRYPSGHAHEVVRQFGTCVPDVLIVFVVTPLDDEL